MSVNMLKSCKRWFIKLILIACVCLSFLYSLDKIINRSAFDTTHLNSYAKTFGNICLNADFVQEHSISIWTMLTDDSNYVKGALKLGTSILRHKTVPVDLIVMELSNKTLPASNWTRLKEVGWKRCTVHRIAPRDEYNTRTNFRDQFTKLYLWSLMPYDTIIYLDSDSLVVGNIDPLIKLKLKSHSIGVARDLISGKWQETFNMGVFVIHPNITEYERLIKLKTDLSVIFPAIWAEQGFLNVIYKDKWLNIGFIYNANLAVYSGRRRDWKKWEKNIHVIHYTVSKPWSSCRRGFEKMCKIWKDAPWTR